MSITQAINSQSWHSKETKAAVGKWNRGIDEVNALQTQATKAALDGQNAVSGSDAATLAAIARTSRWDARRAESALLASWGDLRQMINSSISSEITRIQEAFEAAREERLAGMQKLGINVKPGYQGAAAHSDEEKRLAEQLTSVKNARFGVASVGEASIRQGEIEAELRQLFERM